MSKRRFSNQRDLVSFAISASLHTGLVLSLALIPARSKVTYDTVDLSVTETPRALEPEPEPEPEPEAEAEAEPEPSIPRAKKAKSDEPPPAPPPEEPPPPPEAPEAPPVFDLGDNTFAAGEGQGTGWTLQRSEGNTKFAGLAKKDQAPVRNTAPKGDPNGVAGGRGQGPVALKDLSAQPRPRNGGIALPAYPIEARRNGIEGPVVLQVFINAKGDVVKARIVKDPGGGLGEVARLAMLKEKWTPPLDKQGKPVNTVIIYSYRFVLDG